MEPAADHISNRYALAGALLLGVALFVAGFDGDAVWRYLVAVIAAGAAMLPPVRRRVEGVLGRLRSPSRQAKWVTFGLVTFLAGWYFVASAIVAERGLFPKLHDEHMYLLQARMLASGRLWMPRHELAPFFDSFHILVEPVYAATYFPGAAMFYVPGVWLGLPPWVTSVAVCALVVGLLYLVMTELFDGVAGVLAAVMAVALTQVRVLATVTQSHPVMLLLLLVAAWAYVRWRRECGMGWAAVFGAAAGWAAVTRPLDAVCLVGPLCLAFAWDLLRQRRPGLWRRTLVTIVVVVGAAAPFLALQFAFNRSVTGSFLDTPFGRYARTTFPGLEFGFGPRAVPAESPASLEQVRDYYQDFFRPDLLRHGREPFVRTWVSGRLVPAADVALPARVFLVLLPVGLLCVGRGRATAALAAGALTLPLAYTFYPSYLTHYGVVCLGAFVTLAVGGEYVLRRRLPSGVSVAVTIGVVALCVASLPELRGARDLAMQAPYLADINEKLSRLEHVPAVVLFHYDSRRTDVHEEPVYNLDAAWPDDAEIVRAHDRGAENWRIFEYYASRQPRRYFYLYNRTTAELTPLGWAADLAARRSAP